ncbi:Rho-binding antiterminator [Rosenbergiella australiborealis]|uniref:Rho-binding antiterminator n=1 Tax=Rosenbergiella australiborealis TaxID=1544696 RepID=A0ABS5T1N6_9GAMM|nr:Rho-binding antiterminator [Rosenbergiella australiborealis]MBT0726262.1 Rho-binding antiterminator [Rosenbergiella australiborealis]
MSINDTYQPINCDDYDNLELACQHHLLLQLTLKNGETLKAEAADLFLRKKVEYLLYKSHGEQHEVRLDNIESFSHPEIGTITITQN